MDFAAIIVLALKASIVLTVAALGLGASPRQASYLIRHPRRLVLSMLSLFVVMPLVASALAAAFHFHEPVEVALVALAVSPVPPLLPRKALKAGGGLSYTIGLLAAAALLAVVFMPLTVDLVGRAFGRTTHLAIGTVVVVVLITVIAPLAVGMAARTIAPGFAERIADPVGKTALVLLIVSALPIVVHAWPDMRSLIGNGTIVAFVVFTLAGLAAGHMLGGPEPDDRTVLALSTGCRHPGVALSVATANVAAGTPVLAAVGLYLIVSAVLSLLYLAWRRHSDRLATPAARA